MFNKSWLAGLAGLAWVAWAGRVGLAAWGWPGVPSGCLGVLWGGLGGGVDRFYYPGTIRELSGILGELAVGPCWPGWLGLAGLAAGLAGLPGWSCLAGLEGLGGCVDNLIKSVNNY